MIVNVYYDLSESRINLKPIMDTYFKTFISRIISGENGFEVRQLLNLDTFPTDEQGTKIVEKIKSSFAHFIEVDVTSETGISLAEEDKKFILDNFKVNILVTFKDEEENGFSWYWFAHSGQFINQ